MQEENQNTKNEQESLTVDPFEEALGELAASNSNETDQEKSTKKQDEKKEQDPEKPEEKAAASELDKEEDGHELKALKEELAKEKARAAENYRLIRQKEQRFKNAEKTLKNLFSNGGLLEEEFEVLSRALETGGETEGDIEDTARSLQHPFSEIFAIADKELETLKKYSEDDLFDEKVLSFNHYLNSIDKESLEDLKNDLDSLKENPTALAKKMLTIGKEHHDNGFKEIKEAGSLKAFLGKIKDKEERLLRQVDKLKKKLAQYEDYNSSSYDIDSVQESANGKTTLGDPFNEAVDELSRRR